MDKSQLQKNHILRTAFALFCEKGYFNTTTREIAEAAAINKGSLHYYYNKKEDIVYDLFNELFDGLSDYLEREHQPAVKGLDYIALLNMTYFKVVTSRPCYTRILAEILSNNILTKYKIEASMKSCFKTLADIEPPVTQQQLLLAMYVSIGSEAQLLPGIVEKSVSMGFEELAVTIERLFLQMLKIEENETDRILSTAIQSLDKISLDALYCHLKKVCPCFR